MERRRTFHCRKPMTIVKNEYKSRTLIRATDQKTLIPGTQTCNSASFNRKSLYVCNDEVYSMLGNDISEIFL